MTFPVSKTADHTIAVGNLLSVPVAGEQLFPTYVVTSDGVEIGPLNAMYVQPGTGTSWAVTGPLTDTQLRATAVPVSLASIPLGTDAATATKQDSQTTHLATLAGAVATGKMQVDVISSALPTNAATGAKQDAIISAIASIDGHVDGVEGSLTSIDAKMTACNTGAVVIASSALPTNAATSARQDTGNTSLASIDGKIPSLGQALAAASVPVVLTAAQISTLTPLTTLPTVTNLAQLGGANIAMGTGVRSAGTQRVTIATDDVVPVSMSGTWTVGLSAGTNAIGKLAANSGVVIGSIEIASAQTLATVTTVTTVTTLSTLTGGGVAHDGVDSGNPIKVGAKAVTSQSGQTAVASGDRTDLIADLDGSIPTRMACHSDNASGVATTTGTTDTSVVAAQGASTYFYATGISVVNTGATTSLITFKDGSGGSALWYAIVPAGGGYNFNGGNKAIFKTSANTALYFAAGSASTTIYCSVTGYKSKV